MLGDSQQIQPTIKPKSSKWKKSLISIQIFAVIGILILIYFLDQTHFKKIYTGGTEEIIIEDNTISKEEAELRTIDSNVDSSPVSEEQIQIGSLKSDLNNENDFVMLDVFRINADGTLTISPVTSAQGREIYPLVFAQRDVLENVSLDVNSLIVKIFNELSVRNYSNIVIDHTLLRASNYIDFLQQAKLKASSSNIKFSMKIFPLWGKVLDYRFHGNISGVIGYSETLFSFLRSADRVFVEAYGFTNEYSMLAGPIAPVEWIKDAMEFYIFEEIPREKIFLIANSKKYLWEKREFEPDPKKNFSVGLEEGKVQDSISMNEISRERINSSFEDMVIYKDPNGKEYIAVEATETSMQRVLDLVLEFGLGGVVL